MERWIMNRLGFVNFWVYDEEVFPLKNGKILLASAYRKYDLRWFPEGNHTFDYTAHPHS